MNLAADFLTVTDALESVTLKRPGSSLAASVTALRRAARTDEALPSRGRVLAGDVRWHLHAAIVPWPPQPGDQIVDASGAVWTVLESALQTLASRWRCDSRDLAVAHGLDAVVSIERAVFRKGPGGAQVPVWETAVAGVKARIQPEGADVLREHGRRSAPTQFVVTLGETVELDQQSRIVGPDGSAYAVVGWRGPERIGELMRVNVEQAGWPLARVASTPRRSEE